MLAINVAAGVVSMAILFGIYHYLKRTSGPARWADSQRSYHLQQIRANLLAAAEAPEHPRDWRPQLLLFSDDPHRRKWLLRFAEWLESDTGFVTVVRILEGEGVKMRKVKAEAEAELQQDIQKEGAHAFPLVVAAPNLQVGIQTVVQAYGVGSLKANTILLNWLGESPSKILGLQGQNFGRNIRSAHIYGCNIVILDVKADKWSAIEETDEQKRFIDVWWWGDATSRLMLLIAYLMTRHEKWDETRIRLLAVDDGSQTPLTVDSLKEMLEEVRIDADPEIVKDVDADSIAEYSADAALAFIPFRIKDNQVVDPFGNPMEDTLFLLPVTAMVLAAEDIDLDAEPEEGKAGEMAEAIDALEDAGKKADTATKEAQKATAALEKAKEKIESIKSDPDGADSDTLAAAEKEAAEAEKQAAKMTRKAAKATAKAEAAAREAEASGVLPEEPKKE
jgi:hypothetical protein